MRRICVQRVSRRSPRRTSRATGRPTPPSASAPGVRTVRTMPAFTVKEPIWPTRNSTPSSPSFTIAGVSAAFASLPVCRQQKTRSETLLVQPHIFHPQSVVDAVDHRHVVLHVGLPAGPRAVVIEDRPRDVFGQAPLDVPDQLPALVLVGFHRLLVEQLVDLRVAVAVVVAFRTAGIILVECLVGIVDAVAGEVGAD